jgi:hypothetical protein
MGLLRRCFSNYSEKTQITKYSLKHVWWEFQNLCHNVSLRIQLFPSYLDNFPVMNMRNYFTET